MPAERANSIAEVIHEGRPNLSAEVFKAEICIRAWLPVLREYEIELPVCYLDAWKELKKRRELEDADRDVSRSPLFRDSDDVIRYMYTQDEY